MVLFQQSLGKFNNIAKKDKTINSKMAIFFRKFSGKESQVCLKKADRIKL